MDPMIAQIMLFAGNFAPRGWAFCDGQLLSIAQNTALFSIIGTTYGGDGRTTFALPDLRGRAPIHPGTGPGLSTRKLGQRSGLETNTLNVLQMPIHNHIAQQTAGSIEVNVKVQASSAAATLETPTDGAVLAAGNEGAGRNTSPVKMYNETTPDIALGGVEVVTNPTGDSSITVGTSGGSQPVNNMQPFLGVNYIIALVGIFPSRS
ncbi:phage tail protein [Polaribacter sp. Hel1_85]|uniref:phage tail protein n=1 Tax=Polaribacter sp. Hel1_85 TaxID=1250005 RepID=UPI00052B821B|nr:tail fiber protein [Polaribacter sp. Hel1_85]KGL61991.1 microcystin dependent protein [Polaribacter sp. Hel1_85]